jgi:hypothetical protein
MVGKKRPFSIIFDKCRISDKNFEILITLLSRASGLKTLKVTNASLTLKPVTMDKNLQNFLKKSHLYHLNLSGNRIGLDGVLALSQSLVVNTSLQKLNLSRNEIGFKGT